MLVMLNPHLNFHVVSCNPHFPRGAGGPDHVVQVVPANLPGPPLLAPRGPGPDARSTQERTLLMSKFVNCLQFASKIIII